MERMVIVPSARTSAIPSSPRRSPRTPFALAVSCLTAEPSYSLPQRLRYLKLNKRATPGGEIPRPRDALTAAERRCLRLGVHRVLTRQADRDVLEAVECRARRLAELHFRRVERPVEGRRRA